MREVLLLLRHFNDTDNIEPIIYFFLEKDEENSINILYYSLDYNCYENEAIKRLKKKFNHKLRLNWVGEFMNLEISKMAGKGLKSKIYRNYQLRAPWRRCLDNINGNKKFEGTREQFNKEIKKYTEIINKPKILYIDQNRMSSTCGILNEFRKNGVSKVVSLPVSPFVNINAIRSKYFGSPFLPDFEKNHDYSGVDLFVQTDNHYLNNLRKMYRYLNKENKIFNSNIVLGSARYSPEWLKIRNNKNNSKPTQTKRKKILFLLSQPDANSNWNAVEDTIKILGGFQNLSVTIKPHTRQWDINLVNYHANIVIDNVSDSSKLIADSDAILFWGTSVALEGYMNKKIMLVANYASYNNNIFAIYNAGIILNCLDDLYFVINEIILDGDIAAIQNEKNIEEMLLQVIWGGKKGNICERYLKLIYRNECH